MVFETVKETIVNTLNCDAEDVTLTAKIKEDLGADSLDAVELNMALEEAYGIAIPDEKLVGFITVKDIVDYLSNQVEQ